MAAQSKRELSSRCHARLKSCFGFALLREPRMRGDVPPAFGNGPSGIWTHGFHVANVAFCQTELSARKKAIIGFKISIAGFWQRGEWWTKATCGSIWTEKAFLGQTFWTPWTQKVCAPQITLQFIGMAFAVLLARSSLRGSPLGVASVARRSTSLTLCPFKLINSRPFMVFIPSLADTLHTKGFLGRVKAIIPEIQ